MGNYENETFDLLDQFKPGGYIGRNEGIYMCDNVDDIDWAGGATEYTYIVEPVGRVERHDQNWMYEIEILINDAHMDNFGNDEMGSLGDPNSKARKKLMNDIKKAAHGYWKGEPWGGGIGKKGEDNIERNRANNPMYMRRPGIVNEPIWEYIAQSAEVINEVFE
jgi:hypothetical protein